MNNLAVAPEVRKLTDILHLTIKIEATQTKPAYAGWKTLICQALAAGGESPAIIH